MFSILKKHGRPLAVVFTISLAVGFLFYGSFIEPNRLDIHHLVVRDSRLGQLLHGKTVVHLSDLHIARIGKREQRVLRILDELKPDIIFLTGDYVAWEGDYEQALTFLAQLKAKIGIWAVMGDYDYSNSRKSCLFCHEEGSGTPTKRHPVRFLRDSIDMIDLPGGSLAIGGVDMTGEGHTHPVNNLSRKSSGAPDIILSHSPLAFDLFDESRKMLMLSGDTHGGQVPLPSWLLKALGYEKNVRYNQGIFTAGAKTLFVSKGIGTSHLPIRLCRRPEITVLHFFPERDAAEISRND